jgi:hypothetical protein
LARFPTQKGYSIARATFGRPEVHDLLDSSCRLLENVFSPGDE